VVGSARGKARLTDKLEFRLLGPVEVRAGGSPLALGGRKPRSVLALLLLRPGEAVSRAALIDALWGERPPATAATALHGYVSQLRKALEPGRDTGDSPAILVTRQPGYALIAQPDQIDSERFRRLAADGRERLAAGDAEGAAHVLRKALALWRGSALADLDGEEAVAADIARLEEERAAALGDRIDADLTLGRHQEVVGELEALIAVSPLQERPREQLMLALYRCGRQADALAAYRSARSTLVEEVGIEPGARLRELERQVLSQDAALDLESATPPPPAEPAGRGRRRSRRTRAAVASAVVIAVAITIVALAVGGLDGDEKRSVAVAANSLAAIDLSGERIVADVPVGGTPTAISAGEGALWVLNADDQTVSRVDLATHAVKTFGSGGVPVDLAVGEGALWVANGRRGRAQYVGPSASSVSSIDTQTNGVRASVALPQTGLGRLNTNTDRLAVGAGSIWAVGPDYSVSRIDPGTTEIAGHVGGRLGIEAVAAGPEGVWGRDGNGTLVRLDRRGPRVRIGASMLAGIAVGEGGVWATAPHDGKLWRVDSEPQPVARSIDVGAGASAVTTGGGAVWVANALRGTVTRIDPSTDRVGAPVAVGGTPRRLVFAAGRLWVTVAGSPQEQAAASADGGVAGVPGPTCGRVFYGGPGRPDGLIVSDMPLRGGPQVPTQQMADAIAFVVRERGFRAGRYRIAYQSCDDSTEQSGIFDEAKCAANAKAFAALPSVLAEVGPYNSGCAFRQIGVGGADRALPTIGPVTTSVGLTRASADLPEAGVAKLYPGGRRTFARLLPDEAAQGAGAALEARRLGARRVYVLSDGGYGTQMAASFARAARAYGVKVVALRQWSDGARHYQGLAQAVARRSPDLVFVSGLLDTGGGRVIADVRSALGPGVPVLANDGLLPISKLFRSAGPAARGVRVTFPGLTVQGLPPAGRHFVAQFAATQPGGRVDEAAVYAAQATTVMLDAIAASDGTRPSIAAQLLRARVGSGLIGGVRFDARGDPVAQPITILRAQRPGGDARVTSHDGATVERVVYPPPGIGG
jgi:YVTN family beta-propeller protein